MRGWSDISVISGKRLSKVIIEHSLSILAALSIGIIMMLFLRGVYSKRLLQLALISFFLLLSTASTYFSLLLLFVLLVFFTPGTPGYELNVLWLPSLIIPICVVVFIKFLKDAANKKQIGFKGATFANLLFALFFVQVLSSLNAMFPMYSMLHATYFLISSYFVYFLVSQELNSSKRAITFISFIVIICSAVALIGILESFKLISPYASLLKSTLAPTIQVEHLYRATSTLGHSLPFSLFLLIFFPLSLFLIENPLIGFKKVWLICSVLILGGIICSFARGAYISLFVILIIYMTRNLVKERSVKTILAPVAIILLSGVAILKVGPIRDYVFFRFSHEQLTSLDVTHRIYSFETIANILKGKFFLGVGFRHYWMIFLRFAAVGTEDIFTPDNLFLSAAAETGIIGVTVLVLVFFFILKDFLKCYFSTPNSFDKNLLFFVLLGIVSVLSQSFVFSTLSWLNIRVCFWILVGIGASVVYGSRNTDREQQVI